jgi:two-component system, NtrC family, sensor histidine kinase PilS
MDRTEHQSLLHRQLRWLMFFRVVTTTFLLGTTIVVHFRGTAQIASESLTALYCLIGLIYVLTVIYLVILPRIFSEIIQANIQIIGDMLITSIVIYLTGGLESAFSFMYILTIINAGVLLKIRGAILTASISAILYGALLDLHYYGYIDPYMTRLSYLENYRATDILTTILVNMGAFYLVAFLSGYLSRQHEESRKKLAERQIDLERLEDLNDSIVQSIDSGLMTLGRHGEIVSFNPAAERITGFDFAEVAGRSPELVFPKLRLPGLKAGYRHDPAPSWCWEYHRRDGQTLYLDMGLLGLRDRTGEYWGRLLVFQDRTRMRQMEEEVKRIERLAAVGELAAGIAHEIRNPLASISGSFQMLEEDLRDRRDQARLLEIIRRELVRLNHIVDDFLTFARPKSGESGTVDLSRTVEDVLNLFERQEGVIGRVELIRNITPKIHILFDPHQLEQVLWNLLINAYESMPEGGRLTVHVDTHIPDKNRFARMMVQDTGIGIKPENLPRVFDPFFTTKDGGSGLGLSIVYRIIESRGGRIEIDSRFGSGTMFNVMLPLVLPPEHLGDFS